MERKKVTVRSFIRKKKKGDRITMLSVYEYITAALADRAGVDAVLVGDSLAMTMLGYETTLPVTMDEMLCHVKAAARARPRALLIADMPFMSFQVSPEEAVRNAGRMLKEGGAEAVKIEGGRCMVKTVEALLAAKIPVMGHIGLTPQAIHAFGGYRVQGKTESAARALVEDARCLEEAGCFSMVLEGIPGDVAREITGSVSIPTIGIGAGPHCDGQVLVGHDILGLVEGDLPRFVRRYADLKTSMLDAFSRYVEDVRRGDYPALEETYEYGKDGKDGKNGKD
ncbi:MAG: 3-methyl-2-oxobutanoate hydroxymethyltransferase [bacterium]